MTCTVTSKHTGREMDTYERLTFGERERERERELLEYRFEYWPGTGLDIGLARPGPTLAAIAAPLGTYVATISTSKGMPPRRVSLACILNGS
jgi:hypothetical protein